MEQMKSRVLILGGTSEGRELSRFAHEIGLSATVSVVSGYGGDLLEETRYVKVHQGALDREEMERFFERMRPELVLVQLSLCAAGYGAGKRAVRDYEHSLQPGAS